MTTIDRTLVPFLTYLLRERFSLSFTTGGACQELARPSLSLFALFPAGGLARPPPASEPAGAALRRAVGSLGVRGRGDFAFHPHAISPRPHIPDGWPRLLPLPGCVLRVPLQPRRDISLFSGAEISLHTSDRRPPSRAQLPCVIIHLPERNSDIRGFQRPTATGRKGECDETR